MRRRKFEIEKGWLGSNPKNLKILLFNVKEVEFCGV